MYILELCSEVLFHFGWGGAQESAFKWPFRLFWVQVVHWPYFNKHWSIFELLTHLSSFFISFIMLAQCLVYGMYYVFIVQLLSHIQLFVTPQTTAHQASLTFTVSWSLLRFMCLESMMLSNHLILCHPLLLVPSIFHDHGLFQWVGSLHQVASASTSFLPMNWKEFRIGASASASVLPMNIQCWLPLGLTGLSSLLS